MDEKEAEARPVMGTIFLVYVDVHLKTILAVTLFSRCARGSWLEDGVCCKEV